jgi:hypothetical protein
MSPFFASSTISAFPVFFDAEDNQLVIPTKTVSEQFYGQPYSHRFNGRDTLEKFRFQVLPRLAWTEPNYARGNGANPYKGKARQITNFGFDTEMQEALREECLDPSEDQVDFITGLAHRREDRYEKAAEETSLYETELSRHALSPTQTLILDYLRGINAGHLFLRKLRENQEAIQAAISALSPHLQTIRHRILANVQENPNVYYLPSEREHTCRLSARGDSILGLKKTVRRAATGGWVECDLRSSQFAILAAQLDAPVSQTFVATNESLWREFYRPLLTRILNAVARHEPKAPSGSRVE